MAEDPKYRPLPYLYKSIGLHAREAYDRCPEYSYIQSMNTLERDEETMSSRYGYTIQNRDPNGTINGRNYFFLSPVTSIAKMSFGAIVQRYVGLGDGSLWQRNANSQGSFTEIYTGLSGNPFGTVIASCYETALPFLFIYDEDASIKVAAGSSTPELTGIDTPPQTANSVPYSPLLTLIDNFASSNSYTTMGFDVGTPWTYGSIFTITATSGSMVTDFPQFFGASTGGGSSYGPSTGSTSGTVTQFGNGTNSGTSSPVHGYPSVPITPGESLSVTVNISAEVFISSGFGGGEGEADWQYSGDAGVTWSTFYSWSFSGSSPSSNSLPPTNVVISGLAPSNLDLLQLRIAITSTVGGEEGGAPDCETDAQINSAIATITTAGALGGLIGGMLSVFNSNTTIRVPIQSATSINLVGDFYEELEFMTVIGHGINPSASDYIAIYGSSNALVDGFYPATVTASNSFTVPYESSVYLSAAGGHVMGGAAAPSTCVLANNYASPYPTQFSAWGFYQQVPTTTTSFPVGNWGGKIDTNSTAKVTVSQAFDLSQNDQVNGSDLIVIVMQVGSPANIASIQLQFDVNASSYTSSYYTAMLSPVLYQGSLVAQESAYNATQNQILADTLGLLTGQQPTGSTTAQLSPSNFSSGPEAWATIYIPRGNFLPVGNAGEPSLDWSNITGWRLVIQTTATVITGDGSSTVAVNGLYLQWGYGPSSFAGIGYDYRYTYYNANTGTEGSPSPEQEFNEQFGYLSSLSAPFYLRQAAQVSGYYSSDPQVTHYRVYRRGGSFSSNWLMIDQALNITSAGQFQYKDVIADASIAQAQPLVLDNDPPVTSSLVTPIQTTLSAPTTGPGQTFYSTYSPQPITVEQSDAVFVANQIALIGNSNNLEEVSVISGGTGRFTAIVRLQHNAGEPVQVNATPRVFCNLCCIANLPGGATQVLLAGDKSNPHRVYYAKPNQPENFGPENYVDSSSPDDPVMALINWRGTGLVATRNTWYIFVGGSQPYLQPTGAAHGMIAEQGWCLVEGEIAFLAADGWRFFSGADGKYMTLPVEWIFRTNPDCLPPQMSASDASLGVFAYYNNLVLGSYISLNDGKRYRLILDTQYNRYRQDDIGATAMLWERDTNLLLCGVPVLTASNTVGYALVADQQYNQDYDDGGWNTASNALVQTPVNLTIQLPYKDVGKPHFPKQFNVLETDANTENQELQTTLFFNTEPQTSIVLPAVNSGTVRQKLQLKINAGKGQQAYAMSILHTMAVTVAPTLFQENIYATILADYRTSFDTYWQKASSDRLKIWKQGYFDYSASEDVLFSLYANGDTVNPYFQFTLPATANESVVRVLFAPGKFRLWRMIGVSTGDFQLWAPVAVEQKEIEEGSGYAIDQFGVYE